VSTRRVRQHVNPLRSTLLNIELPDLGLREGVPLDVELGSAEAHLMLELAEAHPERQFIGLEIRAELIRRANRQAEKRGLRNFKNVFSNISVDLPRLFPPGRVDRFFLYFPDPWFKKWQHKRRVIEPSLAHGMLRALKPGGEIHVATDIFDLALDAMAALETLADAGLIVNLVGPWRFSRTPPVDARSRREKQCAAQQTRVWRLAYRGIATG
jgi:tRNA (guanine-N7-)-methyltransferase